MMRPRPPRKRLYLWSMWNHSSNAVNAMPPVTRQPPSTAPVTLVIPPRYANAKIVSDAMLPKVSPVTEPKLYPDSAPPRPATKAATPNASILVPDTLMPTAAAARSFDRTASIWRPVTDRRRLTTTRPSTTTTIRQKTPKKGFGSLPSPNVVTWFGPNTSPNTLGGGTFAPLSPPFHAVFLNTKLSIVTANASVTIARFTPRTRSAGIAVRSPKSAATAAPARGPIGNGTFQSVTSFESVKPATPAIVIWAREI